VGGSGRSVEAAVARAHEDALAGAIELGLPSLVRLAHLARRGEDISERVNEALQRIILSVGKVTEIVGEIAETSSAQADGIAQSTKAMASIDQSTQLAAANSEQTSSAAEELASQAEELAGLVRQFRLQSAEQTSERRALAGGARQRGSERAPGSLTIVR